MPELLAPAGNIESFYGVMNAGCDAVYLAGNRFGARAYADNFSDEELLTAIMYAHLYNKKIYLTVNTLIRNDEIADLCEFIRPLYLSGLDAVIVQDIGVLRLLHSTFPGLQLHASTQLSVTGKGASVILKDMGVSRIVPARELNLYEIGEIKKTSVEVECFIHGAMCYCYSGQCLFSSVIGSRSGNRGRCAQPCRLPYKVNGMKDIYPLSLKDMCTIDILEDLIKAGIDSFKIEGRMKKPEYAAGVTSIYRKYIDQFFEKGSINVTDGDREFLDKLYIRSEISSGYYNKYNGPEMVTISVPSYTGADERILETIRDKYLTKNAEKKLKKYPVRFTAVFTPGEKAYISVTYNELTAEVCGDVVESAQKRPITEDDIISSLSKLGNTCLEPDAEDPFYIMLGEMPYYPLKDINELRRIVTAELEDLIIASYGYRGSDLKAETAGDKSSGGSSVLGSSPVASDKEYCDNKYNSGLFNISVMNCRQFEVLSGSSAKDITGHVYITEKMLLCDKETKALIRSSNIPVFVSTAYIRRADSLYLRDYLTGYIREGLIKGVLVRNLEDLEFFKALKEECHDLVLVSDACLYAWNNEAVGFFSENCDTVSLPFELSSGEHNALARNNPDTDFEKMIYGRYPLMQSANCIFKTTASCKKKSAEKNSLTFLKDRTGRDNPVLADCLHCHNTIYNSVPLSVYRLNNTPSNISFRIDLTYEDEKKTSNIIGYYTELITGNTDKKPEWEYTGGFEKKGCE